MADGKLIITRIKRALRNALDAWWVLLIITVYMILSHYFLGTSCLFASTLGMPCPGCGISRAFIALIQGNFALSLHYYPMLIPSIIFVCVYIMLMLVCERKPRYAEKILVIFTIILLCTYAARMILLFPGTEPMVFNQQAILPRIIILFRELIR